MITGIALILIAVFVELPQPVMITLCVLGGLKAAMALGKWMLKD